MKTIYGADLARGGLEESCLVSLIHLRLGSLTMHSPDEIKGPLNVVVVKGMVQKTRKIGCWRQIDYPPLGKLEDRMYAPRPESPMVQHHSKIGGRPTQTIILRKKVGMYHPPKLKKTARLQ